jgi:hypothetical protein
MRFLVGLAAAGLKLPAEDGDAGDEDQNHQERCKSGPVQGDRPITPSVFQKSL